MWACWGRAEPVVDLLVNEYGCELRTRDKHGLTPLHIAATKDAAKICGHLLAPGGTFLSIRMMQDIVGATDKFALNTPLHCACATGAEAAARILCDVGAPLDAQNANGKTPVDVAIEGGFPRIATLCTRARLREKRHGPVDARKQQQKEAIAKMHRDALEATPLSQSQRDEELGFGLGEMLQDQNIEDDDESD